MDSGSHTSHTHARKLIVISVGGSLIVPDKPDVAFLSGLRTLVLSYVEKGYGFILIAGGGRITREYQQAAAAIAQLHNEDLDWLGIHATRLNAHLLRTIFRDQAYPRIIKNPSRTITYNEPILIGAGWKPGFSTDYDAVLLAKNHGAGTVINLTNVDYVYDKDPRHNHDAKPIHTITWAQFRTIVGDTWDPGKNVPFDPVASRLAQRHKLKVVLLNGRNLANFENYLQNRDFVGTVIEG